MSYDDYNDDDDDDDDDDDEDDDDDTFHGYLVSTSDELRPIDSIEVTYWLASEKIPSTTT